ncbi:MAG: dephospho-CoA kinase [Deltaproteobacteria bacterium]|jgi:dephospho-CoA kinase|nr:dephospho-CoA kinase [Deltaproteobacteria bacterium]
MFFRKKKPPGPLKRPEESPPPPWALDPEGLLQSRPGKRIAALTGGIASGKSTALALFEAFGAKVVDFDLLAREALSPFTPTWERTLEIFGEKARLKNNELDRPYLAKKIFGDQKLRLALEAVVHPFTWRRMLEELRGGDPPPLTIVDVPLLFEADLQSLFSPVILCHASPARQLQRLLFRSPGLSRGRALKILRSQLPPGEKLRRADLILNNDGSLRDLIFQTRDLHRRLAAPTDPADRPPPSGDPEKKPPHA